MKEMLQRHVSTGAEATILVTKASSRGSRSGG